MTPRTVNIVCAMTPRIVRIYCNARPGKTHGGWTFAGRNGEVWRCRRCDARVKVVA